MVLKNIVASLLFLSVGLSNGLVTREIDGLVLDWEAQYGSGSVSPDNEPTGMVQDIQGNIVIVGVAVGAVTGKDISVVKYGQDGEVIWAVNHDGGIGLDDNASAVTVDSAGNIYVVGRTRSEDNSDDYLTAKFDDAGSCIWSVSYDGPAGQLDAAKAVAVSSSGAVYVTGYARSLDGTDDICTMKYNVSGVMEWNQQYTGLGNKDRGVVIQVDATGGVVVAGTSEDAARHDDFAIIKYDSDGNELWVKRYNHAPRDHDDEVVDLALDMNDNIIVAGTSAGVDTGDDFAVLKYSPSGDVLWERRYNNELRNGHDKVAALSVDAMGDVYLVGQSLNESNDYEYLTLKYDNSGSEIWSDRRMVGTQSLPQGITIDLDGAVIVTGYASNGATANDYFTIKYSPFGGLVWSRTYHGPDGDDDYGYFVTTTGERAIIVVGAKRALDYTKSIQVVSYASNGNLNWAQRFTGEGNKQLYAVDMVRDSGNRIYVVGYADHENGESTLVILKYGPAGDLLWVRRYQSEAGGINQAVRVKLDQNEDIIVAGVVDSDFGTLKYSSSGEMIWLARYNGANGFIDWPSDLALDSSGNIFVTGYSGLSGYFDYATVKYTPEGSQVWARRYNNLSDANDIPHSIAIDQAENVIVTGESPETGQLEDVVTIKYDQAGNTLWVDRFNGASNDRDRAYKVLIDDLNNIYLGGMSSYSDTWSDLVTWKLDAGGNHIQLYRFGGIGSSYDWFHGLGVDSEHNVYMTGNVAQSAGSALTDIATVKFNSGGDLLWSHQFNGSGARYDRSKALTLDSLGSVYVAGKVETTGGRTDCYVMKYLSDGTSGGSIAWRAANSSNDDPSMVLVDNDGRVWFTETADWGDAHSIHTVKYKLLDDVGVTPEISSPVDLSLSSNFPNPFNAQTQIQFTLSRSTHLALDVMDLRGRVVNDLYRGPMVKGEHRLVWNGTDRFGRELPTGVYLCRLEARGHSKTIKMLLLR